MTVDQLPATTGVSTSTPTGAAPMLVPALPGERDSAQPIDPDLHRPSAGRRAAVYRPDRDGEQPGSTPGRRRAEPVTQHEPSTDAKADAKAEPEAAPEAEPEAVPDIDLSVPCPGAWNAPSKADTAASPSHPGQRAGSGKARSKSGPQHPQPVAATEAHILGCSTCAARLRVGCFAAIVKTRMAAIGVNEEAALTALRDSLQTIGASFTEATQILFDAHAWRRAQTLSSYKRCAPVGGRCCTPPARPAQGAPALLVRPVFYGVPRRANLATDAHPLPSRLDAAQMLPPAPAQSPAPAPVCTETTLEPTAETADPTTPDSQPAPVAPVAPVAPGYPDLREEYAAALRTIEALTADLTNERAENTQNRQLIGDLNFELHDANDARRQAEAALRDLQAALVAEGWYDLAHASHEPTAPPVPRPASYRELIAAADQLAAHGIHLTAPEREACRNATALDLRDPTGDGAAMAWEVICTLIDYRRAKQDGTWTSNLKGYLEATPPGYRTFPSGKFASAESKATMSGFGAERLFPVPTTVHPRGSVPMIAHFRLGNAGGTRVPRLHLFDDTSKTGDIYIGYIGTHLTTATGV